MRGRAVDVGRVVPVANVAAFWASYSEAATVWFPTDSLSNAPAGAPNVFEFVWASAADPTARPAATVPIANATSQGRIRFFPLSVFHGQQMQPPCQNRVDRNSGNLWAPVGVGGVASAHRCQPPDSERLQQVAVASQPQPIIAM